MLRWSDRAQIRKAESGLAVASEAGAEKVGQGLRLLDPERPSVRGMEARGC